VGIRNFSPQFRNISDNQIDCGIADYVEEYDCGPLKFDFRNSATLRSLWQVPLLSCSFSLAQDGLKNQPKILLESSVYGNQKHALKQRPKISCYCPFKILSIAKNTWHGHGHAAWTRACAPDKGVQPGHGHVAWTWTCSMDMQYGNGHWYGYWHRH
jgi:hypothetical protein